MVKSFKEFLQEEKDPCWKGYKQYGMKKDEDGNEVPNCIPEDSELEESEGEYDGRTVKLDNPFRTPDGPKKFSVYVKNDKGNVVKVNFGDPESTIKKDDPGSRKNYRSRHNCDNPGPKWKANYWSCRSWSDNEDWV